MIKKVASTGVAPKGGITFFETELGVATTLATAEYSVTPGSLFPITSITVTKTDGTDLVITAVSTATDEATLATILKTELNKIGYDFTENFGTKKALPSVKVSGQTLTIISELTFKSINSAGSVNFTKKAVQRGKCSFVHETGTTPTASQIITVNGVDRTEAHVWTYGTTSAATVKGYIETALATEISAGTVLSVAVALTGTKYAVTIVALSGSTIELNGTAFTQAASSCVPHFTAS